jgi:Ty3 transposon peptidase
MGRVRENIDVKGQKFWTLFDTGARNTYVVPRVAALLAISEMPRVFRSALAGKVHQTTQAAVLDADIEGCKISTHAMVIDEIGNDEDGKAINVLLGALAMRQWGIRPIPDQEKLDMSHYSQEFLEF